MGLNRPAHSCLVLCDLRETYAYFLPWPGTVLGHPILHYCTHCTHTHARRRTRAHTFEQHILAYPVIWYTAGVVHSRSVWSRCTLRLRLLEENSDRGHVWCWMDLLGPSSCGFSSFLLSVILISFPFVLPCSFPLSLDFLFVLTWSSLPLPLSFSFLLAYHQSDPQAEWQINLAQDNRSDFDFREHWRRNGKNVSRSGCGLFTVSWSLWRFSVSSPPFPVSVFLPSCSFPLPPFLRASWLVHRLCFPCVLSFLLFSFPDPFYFIFSVFPFPLFFYSVVPDFLFCLFCFLLPFNYFLFVSSSSPSVSSVSSSPFMFSFLFTLPIPPSNLSFLLWNCERKIALITVKGTYCCWYGNYDSDTDKNDNYSNDIGMLVMLIVKIIIIMLLFLSLFLFIFYYCQTSTKKDLFLKFFFTFLFSVSWFASRITRKVTGALW